MNAVLRPGPQPVATKAAGGRLIPYCKSMKVALFCSSYDILPKVVFFPNNFLKKIRIDPNAPLPGAGIPERGTPRSSRFLTS